MTATPSNAPTLNELLDQTGDYSAPYGESGKAVIVLRPTRIADYYHLADYVVSSAIGGPALVLIPKV